MTSHCLFSPRHTQDIDSSSQLQRVASVTWLVLIYVFVSCRNRYLVARCLTLVRFEYILHYFCRDLINTKVIYVTLHTSTGLAFIYKIFKFVCAHRKIHCLYFEDISKFFISFLAVDLFINDIAIV